jgi:hypothetical protein
VLSTFDSGIVHQGQRHIDTSPRELAMMFGEWAPATLAVSGRIFFTDLLDAVVFRLWYGSHSRPFEHAEPLNSVGYDGAKTPP